MATRGRLADEGFFERIAEHRPVFFGYAWVDYNSLRRGRMRLIPPDEQFSEWKKDYEAMRQEMFWGDVPSFEELLTVVKEFESKFERGLKSFGCPS